MPDKRNIADQRRVIHELLEGLSENEAASLLGATVLSPADLAKLAEVFRSPRFETFHYIFTRNAEVVGTTAVSCRLANCAATFTGKSTGKYYRNLISKAEKVKADTVYFLHNHPSGIPVPSQTDCQTTVSLLNKEFNKAGLRFGGHIVINSNRYSVIKANGTYDLHDISYDSYDILQMRESGSFFGTEIHSPEELASLAKLLQKSPENSFLAVGLNSRNQCNCLYEVGYDIFDYPDKRILKSAHNWAAASGVVKYALLNFSREKLKRYRQSEIIRSFQKSGIILDIITTDGVSLRESSGFSPAGDYRVVNKKTYEINDYQADYKDEIQPEFDFSEDNKEEDNGRNKNRGKDTGTPAVSGHANSHGSSGDGKRGPAKKPAVQRKESSVDERFGELFMWAGRKRFDSTAQPPAHEPENDLNGTKGSSDERSLRSAIESTEFQHDTDTAGRGTAENFQEVLPDLVNTTSQSGYEIIESVHTQKGHKLFVVQLPDRVGIKQFKEILSKAKALKGYYSKFSRNGAVPGFQFKEKKPAEKFISLLIKTEQQKNEVSSDFVNGVEVPLSAKAAIIAVFKDDKSDLLSDYHGSTSRRKILLGFSKHSKDLFSEMRKHALKSSNPQIRVLGQNDSQEHREKYSMGGGFYLKNGSRHSTGWEVRKLSPYNDKRKNFLESIANLEVDLSLLPKKQDNKVPAESKDDFGIDWDNLDNFHAQLEEEGLVTRQQEAEASRASTVKVPKVNYDHLPELTPSQKEQLKTAIQDYFLSSRIKKSQSPSDSVILKTRNFPKLSGNKFEAHLKLLRDIMGGKVDKALSRLFYIKSAPIKLLMLDQLTKAEELDRDKLYSILSPGEHQYIGDNLLILASRYKYDFKKVTKHCPNDLLKICSFFKDPNDLSTLIKDLKFWMNTRLNGEFDTVENIIADLPDVIQNNFAVSASGYKDFKIPRLLSREGISPAKPLTKKPKLPEYTVTTARLHFDENGISPEVTGVETITSDENLKPAKNVLKGIPDSAPMINPPEETVKQLAKAFELWREDRNNSEYPVGDNIRRATMEVWLELNAPAWKLHSEKVFSAWQQSAVEKTEWSGFEPVYDKELFQLSRLEEKRDLNFLSTEDPLESPDEKDIRRLAIIFERWRKLRDTKPYLSKDQIDSKTFSFWLKVNVPAWQKQTEVVFTEWQNVLSQRQEMAQKEIELATKVYEEIKDSIKSEDDGLDLRDFHTQLNQKLGFDEYQNAKTRVSAYAHGFTDEELDYNKYGWTEPDYPACENIELKPFKKGWAPMNYMSLRKYPNNCYGAACNIMFGNGGSGSHPLLYNSFLFHSREKAICTMADKMITQYKTSDSREAKFYLKEAKRIKSEHGNILGELFANANKPKKTAGNEKKASPYQSLLESVPEKVPEDKKEKEAFTNQLVKALEAWRQERVTNGKSDDGPLSMETVFSWVAFKANNWQKEVQDIYKTWQAVYDGDLKKSYEPLIKIESEEKEPVEELSPDLLPKIDGAYPERNANNFIIKDPEDLAPSGDISKIKANIQAVKTLKLIEQEERSASTEEMALLSRYAGWGGLKNIFSRYEVPIKWAEYASEIKELLTDEEWNSAAQSVLNAHYTAPEVIKNMWQAALRLGFKGGHVLEPAGGVGHFIGLVPDSVKKRCHFHTVECDSLSARILAQLYPDANNQESYFEYASLKNNSMDLIISNVPFLENPHRDPNYPKMHLHDYFFNRSMDLLKPGGVMLAVSTCGSLDSMNSRKSRLSLAQKADLVGAVRLPSNAFKKNAGAEVTADILILRKKDERRYQGEDFSSVKKMPGSEQVVDTKINRDGEEEDVLKSIEINEYYLNNPHMLLGEMKFTKGRFADRLEQSLVATEEDLGSQLKEAFETLPLNLINKAEVEDEYEAVIAGDEIKPYSFLIDEKGEVVQKVDGFLEKADGFDSAAMKKRAVDFIELRDLAVSAVNAQVNAGLSDQLVEEQRLALVDKFTVFEKRHGSPWAGNIQRQFRLDPEFALILSLQESTTVIEDAQIKCVQKPTGLLKGRTAWPLRLPEKAENLEDAFHISLAYKGRIDLAYISDLIAVNEADCRELILSEGLAFIDPQSGLLINKADYLSGNVRSKLEVAEALLTENPDYAINIEALKEVQPEPIGIDSINFRLGSQWIDSAVLNQWSKSNLSGSLQFRYSDAEYKWYMSGSCYDDPELSTERVSTKRLIEVTLALRNIEVFDLIRDGKTERRVLNEMETAFALEKQAALKENFVDFVKNSSHVFKKVEEDYNRTFNSFAPKEYAVPPIKYFPGAAHIMEGRDYQKSAIVRAVHEPVLLAHAVGAGKTFEMITTVMEKKRLGIARKSMIVVQNATVAQFATFAKSLYPNAKILAPLSKTEYAAKKRQLFLSRIASNDWDAVIIPQSFFNLIKDDPDFVRSYYEERIEEYKAAKAESSDKVTVRNMEKAIERFQAIADTYIHEKGDDTLYFSQLGVDCLVLDEAHEYKKVGIATSLGAVKGLDTGVSQRAQRAYMKIRYIREKSNGRNVILATGTPITNTLAELYTMLRLTNEKTLEAYGIHEFDQFAAVFTEAVTSPELTSTNKLKMVTRLSKFINQPELIRMFRTSADVITGTQLSSQKGVEKPQIIGGRPQAVVIPRGDWLGSYIQSLQAELEDFENMSGKEKKQNSHIPLTVMSRARKAAIDPRLIAYVQGLGHPSDDPESKTNTVVREILKIALETDDLNGTQMVFSDLYQSPDGSFNLFKDMKAKLVDAGMKEDEIAIIHDYTTDSQRERLFADMNSGKVRVLFGTTERMGVGVNAQERMKAMHHMDAPWMPMQMEQRIGRIVRHGNVYAHNGGVYVQTYGVEKTMDAAIFQKILTKQKFIEAILEGKVNERVIEDESSDMALSAQEFTALFSGNPDVMRKFELESEIKTLRIQKDSWRKQMRTSRGRVEILTEKLAELEKIIPQAEEKLAELEGYAGTFEQGRQIEINGQPLADDKVKETLDQFARTHISKAAVIAVNSSKDYFEMDIPDTLKINGRKLNLRASVKADLSGQITSAQISYQGDSCYPFDISGQVASGFGVLSSFKQNVSYKPKELFEDLQKKYEQLKQDKSSTEDFLNKPFRREAELQERETELASIVLNSENNSQKQEPDMNNMLSPFRAWMQEHDVKSLALKVDLDGEQEEMLLAFKEQDRDNLPLDVLWKMEDLLREENIVFLSEEVERKQADSQLLQAYSRALAAYRRLMGEFSQKEFERSQTNTKSVANEVILDTLCLSQALHGLCNDQNKTWDHCKRDWVDEVFVPTYQGQFTDAPKPEHLKNLIQSYNIKLGGAQTDLSNATANKIKV